MIFYVLYRHAKNLRHGSPQNRFTLKEFETTTWEIGLIIFRETVKAHGWPSDTRQSNMASYFRKIPYKQDLPPPGGYPKIEHNSKLPKRGPPGLIIMAGGLGVMAVGFYYLSKGNQKRRFVLNQFATLTL